MLGEARPIEVNTATAQMQVVGKRHYGRKAVPTGGGGGRQGARQLFDTLLLWRGRVALDANGEAELEVPINDSLTAFRLAAVASAGADLFGLGEGRIRTHQDAMLLSGLLPTVREGDRYLGAFTVRNGADRALQLNAQAQVAAAQGPALPALVPQSVELAPGEARTLTWEVAAPRDAGVLTWNVSVEEAAGAARDALQVTAARDPRRAGAGLPGDGDAARRPVRARGAAAGRCAGGSRRAARLSAGTTGRRPRGRRLLHGGLSVLLPRAARVEARSPPATAPVGSPWSTPCRSTRTATDSSSTSRRTGCAAATR